MLAVTNLLRDFFSGPRLATSSKSQQDNQSILRHQSFVEFD